jgi:hypothetical protein
MSKPKIVLITGGSRHVLMRHVCFLLLLAMARPALACKRLALAGSTAFWSAVIEQVKAEKYPDHSIEGIRVVRSTDYVVQIRGDGNACRKLIYKVSGQPDCSVQVSKVSETDCVRKPRSEKRKNKGKRERQPSGDEIPPDLVR